MHEKTFAYEHINPTPHPVEQQVEQCDARKRWCFVLWNTDPDPTEQEIISGYILSTLDSWTASLIDLWMRPWTEVTTNLSDKS